MGLRKQWELKMQTNEVIKMYAFQSIVPIKQHQQPNFLFLKHRLKQNSLSQDIFATK